MGECTQPVRETARPRAVERGKKTRMKSRKQSAAIFWEIQFARARRCSLEARRVAYFMALSVKAVERVETKKKKKKMQEPVTPTLKSIWTVVYFRPGEI